jgi:POT family proton-dependent oligopeptide transporter
MGINMGAFLSPFVVGTVGMDYSFHLGFGLAAIGMLIGLIVFVTTKKKNLGLAGTLPANPLSQNEKKSVFTKLGIAALIIAAIIGITASAGILTIETFINLVSILGIVIPTLYFIFMFY